MQHADQLDIVFAIPQVVEGNHFTVFHENEDRGVSHLVILLDLGNEAVVTRPGSSRRVANGALRRASSRRVVRTPAAGRVETGRLWGLLHPAHFEVTGQNPSGPTNALTDASGVGEFTYSVPVEPESLGLDTITATAIIDGDPGTRTATKEWVDTIPPDSACVATVNPSRKTLPKAPGNGGQGQNQDGFYELTATDNLHDSEDIDGFVVDTGSGAEFGPFPVGTRIKYTEANGTTPRYKAMGANNGNGKGKATAVDFHIWGKGDASLFAVDGLGNVSTRTACLVPPLPK